MWMNMVVLVLYGRGASEQYLLIIDLRLNR